VTHSRIAFAHATRSFASSLTAVIASPSRPSFAVVARARVRISNHIASTRRPTDRTLALFAHTRVARRPRRARRRDRATRPNDASERANERTRDRANERTTRPNDATKRRDETTPP
jgi:hypothetical protein